VIDIFFIGMKLLLIYASDVGMVCELLVYKVNVNDGHNNCRNFCNFYLYTPRLIFCVLCFKNLIVFQKIRYLVM
jgi:hypothetical protein